MKPLELDDPIERSRAPTSQPFLFPWIPGSRKVVRSIVSSSDGDGILPCPTSHPEGSLNFPLVNTVVSGSVALDDTLSATSAAGGYDSEAQSIML